MHRLCCDQPVAGGKRPSDEPRRSEFTMRCRWSYRSRSPRRPRCQGGSCGAQEALRIRDVINVLPARKPPDTKDVARCGYDTRDHQSTCCRASQDSCRVRRRRCRRAAGRTAEGRGTGREGRTAEQHSNQVSACQRSTRAHLGTILHTSTPSSCLAGLLPALARGLLTQAPPPKF